MPKFTDALQGLGLAEAFGDLLKCGDLGLARYARVCSCNGPDHVFLHTQSVRPRGSRGYCGLLGEEYDNCHETF